MPSAYLGPPDTFSKQSALNIVLPGESVDEAIRRYVLRICSESLRRTAEYRNWLREATKRYEALRSTRSLDRDDPGTPWTRASNVGMPLEAIMGEALIPRLNASTVDSKPMYRVSLDVDDQELKQTWDERLTDFYQDVLMKGVRLRPVRDETHRNLMVDGDAFEEPQWDDRWVQTARTVAILQDANGEFMQDEAGMMRVFPANLNPEAIPEDPLTGGKLKKIIVQAKDVKHVYEGATMRTWRVDECIWPWDATTPEINELDWFAIQAWKTPSWFKTRVGDPIQGKLKNVENLLLRHKHGIPSVAGQEDDSQLTAGVTFPKITNKLLLWRFFGLFDVDNDGIDEEIMVLLAPRERVLLGWRLASFSERPFFHYWIYRIPGRFTNRGIPHLAKGMRDMIDFHLNMANNRSNIFLKPPLLYEQDSGFDPDVHMFGVGVTWGPLNPGGSNKIRMLDMPKSQEQLSLEFILFYISMLQRLTGVSDFTLGGPSSTTAPNIKTASGQALVQQEGNVKFADFINAFQELNERQIEFIDREFMSVMTDANNLSLMSNKPMDPQILRMPKSFTATGNSTTMNKQVLQNVSLMVFDRFAADPIFNLSPEISRQLRQRILDFFDVNDIQLPPAEQIGDLQRKMLTDALQALPDEEKANLLQSLVQAGGTSTVAPAEATNGGPVLQR